MSRRLINLGYSGVVRGVVALELVGGGGGGDDDDIWAFAEDLPCAVRVFPANKPSSFAGHLAPSRSVHISVVGART